MKKENMIGAVISAVIFISGFAIVCIYANWKVAVGMFLLTWGSNFKFR